MKKFFEYANDLTVIDSHEHLPRYEDEKETDILGEYLSYICDDLISAGMNPKEMDLVRDSRHPIMQRWKMLEPYWELARNTGYIRSLDLSVKGVYGINRVDESTLEELNGKFLESRKQGKKHFQRVLKELCKIEYSVQDVSLGYGADTTLHIADLDSDRYFFRDACRMDRFVYPITWEQIEGIERLSGIPIVSFESWLDACEFVINRAVKKGAVALKICLAYKRSLYFERVSRKDAEECFYQILKVKNLPSWGFQGICTTKAFQDYMMHYILEIANRYSIVVQFHTGTMTTNRADLSNTNPILLNNLFVEYSQVKFDIFHIGYPFQSSLSALGKMFPNVFLNMCWAHIISPAACVQTLDDWFDAVPINKIIAFGGDQFVVDCVYGHELLAKMNVSEALAKKVNKGFFEIEQAKWIAKRLFYDNPKELYGM